MGENIQRIFEDDVRDKKRTGTGVFSRASRRGYVGKMRTPYDGVKYKAKKEYMGNGKVVTYNMFEEQIVELDTFENFDKARQKELLELYREKFTTEEIKKTWRMNTYAFYNLLKKLGIQVKPIGTLTEAGKEKKRVAMAKAREAKLLKQRERQEDIFDIEDSIINEPEVAVTVEQKVVPKANIVTISNGLSIMLEGEYEGKIFGEKVRKLLALLEDDSSMYKIKLEIVESA